MTNIESHETDDVIVIGGGVNGCGIARDLAGRGVRVRLFEANDLASGTSSSSTKLIHGGLRYLEHFEFGLVRDALSEREKLWSIAPHIVWPMRFVLPHLPGGRPGWLVRLGLFLYDHIGARKLLPTSRSINLKKDVAGRVLRGDIASGAEYSDCWVDDARLVVLNARDAANRGAHIHPQTRVVSFAREADHWSVIAEDKSGKQTHCRAKVLVNAAGPSAEAILTGNDMPSATSSRLVRGSHIIVKKLFEHDKAYFCQNDDGRIFFAIPYEDDFTLIGTTEAEHEGLLSEVKASDEEVLYLCEASNRYFEQQIAVEQVVWTYSGVRPLIDDGADKAEAATRGFRLDLDGGENGEAGVLSVFGGKITSYRELADEACDLLADWLPDLARRSWTADEPLPGGDFPVTKAAEFCDGLAKDFPFLPLELVNRYARTYGTVSRQFLGEAASLADLGRDFGHGLYQAEVDHLIRNEWASSAQDVLWRRTKMGLRLDAQHQQMLSDYIEMTV